MDFKQLFDRAIALGFEAIQATLEYAENIDLQVFNGDLDKHQMSDTKQLTLKAIYQGKMGKFTTEVIDLSHSEAWLEALKNSSMLIESNDEVFIYEGDQAYRNVEGLYNETLTNTPIEKKMDLVFGLDKAMRDFDPRVALANTYYSESRKKVWIQNSKGLSLVKEVNNAFLGAQLVAKTEDDSRSAFDYVQSNDMNDFDVSKLAQEIAEKGLSMLGAKSIPSGEYEIVLKNTATTGLLQAHVSMFSAESVQKGMSKLKGKIGEQIANQMVSIVDDPFKPKSTRSGAFDDEGVATDIKALVQEGQLKGYMHNLKTAKKDGVSSTGNGFGGNVSTTNFYIQPGSSEYDSMVKSMKKGLIIDDLQGTHAGTNAISGDFSLQANGYLVEDGKIVKPVALITVAGNFLELLQDVEAIGNDLKFNFAYVGAPSLKLKKLAVSGE